MKKSIVIYGLLMVTGFNCYSQTYVAQFNPVGSKEWGYIKTDGEILIPAQYRRCHAFSEEGLAVIYDKQTKRFYFINLKGEKLDTEVKDFRMKEAFGFGLKGFEFGMVQVKYDDKWGYLNTEGKAVIPAKYDYVSEFEGEYAVTKIGDAFYIIDKKGTETSVKIPDLADVRNFSEGLAPFKTTAGNFGFIDTKGNKVIEAQYDGVGYFVGGLAWAKTTEGTIGYIKSDGQWAIKPQYKAAKNFDPASGIARVKDGDVWLYINKSGEKTPTSDSEIVEDFIDGLARGRKENKFGYYNTKGEWVIEPKFDGARDFINGFALAKSGDLWGIIDKSGSWVVEPEFAGLKDVAKVK
ncbi:MAG: WG repeat-containing protein [Bacteroidales bacterium]|nr:WG repeat-containing protein [Bacteroidales bacterium]